MVYHFQNISIELSTWTQPRTSNRIISHIINNIKFRLFARKSAVSWLSVTYVCWSSRTWRGVRGECERRGTSTVAWPLVLADSTAASTALSAAYDLATRRKPRVRRIVFIDEYRRCCDQWRTDLESRRTINVNTIAGVFGIRRSLQQSCEEAATSFCMLCVCSEF